MASPDEMEARRISAQLETLERQRLQGNLPYEDTPLRLYRVKTGGFVRVLDRNPEPISPGMVRRPLALHRYASSRAGLMRNFTLLQTHLNQLEAIDAFIHSNAGPDASSSIEEQKVAVADSEVHFEADIEPSVDGMARNEILPENEAGSADTETADACTTGNIEDIDGNLTAHPVSTAVDVQPPWETPTAMERPQELLARNERVSDWLNPRQHLAEESITHQTAAFSSSERSSKLVESAASRQSVDHRVLFEQWPPQLEERRHIWFLPPPSSKPVDSTNSAKAQLQPVVYWMSNALRVTQGNYALEAAILLSRRLNAPLVVVCLVPSSLIYPTCHAATASDAYARYSFVEMYEQFAQVKVPFYGITAKEDGSLVPQAEKQPFILEPNPLFQLLDAFTPQAVVADSAFDAPSRSDIQRLARYLNLNRSSCSWSLLSMDSTTCCPAYRRSPKLQATLERGIQFASECQFGAEYAAVAQPSNETYEFSPLSGTATQAAVQTQLLSEVLQQLHLEEVDWRVVKAANSQSSPQMQRFSEAEGLQKLSQLLAESRGQPAIQAELQGGGILSLLPFIRHGSLFAGYVLRRISEAIVSCPAPNTPQERKALAMRKVMRSRAVNHLGKERDYALYLALWAAIQSEPSELDSPDQHNLARLSTSETLFRLRSSSPRSSSLEIYQKLLPTWAFSSARLDESTDGHLSAGAVYDPYELESARTKDLYWNEIQKFLVEHQYLHPLLVVYWAYRVLTWSVSGRAAIATIESLMSQCALGSTSSPDAVFVVWKQLFRLGMDSNSEEGGTTSRLGDFRSFQLLIEGELASQPKLQLRP